MIAAVHRDLTGEGQWVDVSAMESLDNNAKMEAAAVLYAGQAPSRFLKDVVIPMPPEVAADAYVSVMRPPTPTGRTTLPACAPRAALRRCRTPLDGAFVLRVDGNGWDLPTSHTGSHWASIVRDSGGPGRT